MTDARGTPLAAKVTPANRNDFKDLIQMVRSIPPVSGKVGAPKRKPDAVLADRGYRHPLSKPLLWTMGIEPLIPDKPFNAREVHGSGLGVWRWVVERTISWLHRYRRLRVRYERTAEIHQAFLTIACILVCYKRLRKAFC